MVSAGTLHGLLRYARNDGSCVSLTTLAIVAIVVLAIIATLHVQIGRASYPETTLNNVIHDFAYAANK